MDIRLIFPERTPGEYSDELTDLNRHIDEDNRRTLPIRVLAEAIYISCLVVTGILSVAIWYLIIRLITAQPVPFILVGIVLMAVIPFAVFYMVHTLVRKLTGRLVKGLDAEFDETYTESEYTERKDEAKYARPSLDYYGLCAVLKESSIYDASVNIPKGSNKANVSLAYTDSENKSHVASVLLPFIYGGRGSAVTIDFDQKHVMIPRNVN